MLKKSGFSVIGLLIIVVSLAFTAIYGMKIAVPYYNFQVVDTIVANALEDAKKNPDLSRTDLQTNIFNRLNVQQQTIPFEKIIVKPQDSGWIVLVDMQSSVPLWKKAYLILDLQVERTTTAP